MVILRLVPFAFLLTAIPVLLIGSFLTELRIGKYVLSNLDHSTRLLIIVIGLFPIVLMTAFVFGSTLCQIESRNRSWVFLPISLVFGTLGGVCGAFASSYYEMIRLNTHTLGTAPANLTIFGGVYAIIQWNFIQQRFRWNSMTGAEREREVNRQSERSDQWKRIESSAANFSEEERRKSEMDPNNRTYP